MFILAAIRCWLYKLSHYEYSYSSSIKYNKLSHYVYNYEDINKKIKGWKIISNLFDFYYSWLFVSLILALIARIVLRRIR